MELNLPITFWTPKSWKIRAFDHNQHIGLIMYTNSRFQSIGATSDFETKFAQNSINSKTELSVTLKLNSAYSNWCTSGSNIGQFEGLQILGPN